MTKTYNQLYLVKEIRELTESTYVVSMERNGLEFRAGQNINLGLVNDPERRDYSIYSGEQDNKLEVLVKEVKEGLVSKKLKWLKEGDRLDTEGPFGFFTIKDEDLKSKKFLFIASGTGIAPFHSMVKSYPDLNYTFFTESGIVAKLMINKFIQKNVISHVSQEMIMGTLKEGLQII